MSGAGLSRCQCIGLLAILFASSVSSFGFTPAPRGSTPLAGRKAAYCTNGRLVRPLLECASRPYSRQCVLAMTTPTMLGNVDRVDGFDLGGMDTEEDSIQLVAEEDLAPAVRDEDETDPDEEVDPADVRNFAICEQTLNVLAQRGITKLFPVQAATFNEIYSGRDVLARARTGTGKTLGFALPILERLIVDFEEASAGTGRRRSTRGKNPNCVILSPTRELAQQVEREIESLTENCKMRVKTLCVYGGVSYNKQEREVSDQHTGGTSEETSGRRQEAASVRRLAAPTGSAPECPGSPHPRAVPPRLTLACTIFTFPALRTSHASMCVFFCVVCVYFLILHLCEDKNIAVVLCLMLAETAAPGIDPPVFNETEMGTDESSESIRENTLATSNKLRSRGPGCVASVPPRRHGAARLGMRLHGQEPDSVGCTDSARVNKARGGSSR